MELCKWLATVAPLFDNASFIGTACGGRWLVYSLDYEWGCRVFDIASERELVDPDGDWPRFWLLDNGWLHDGLEDVSSELVLNEEEAA